MRAMILAAGRGERMRPLTDHCPKPLLSVGGKPLIVYQIENLVRLGVTQIVINHAWLGEQIPAALGNGLHWGIQIHYSPEHDGGLETGGGIYQALPLLGDKPFLVVNGDIYSEGFPMEISLLQGTDLAHLYLVDNPKHNLAGDFSLQQGRVYSQGAEQLTFAGIGIYHPRLFTQCQGGKFPLAPLLRQEMDKGNISGERLPGYWCDVGTPERLTQLEQRFNAHIR